VRVRQEHGDRLAALVHVAGGVSLSGPLDASDVDVWQRMLSINLTTAYLVTRAFLPMLRAGKGAIVYFASESALPDAKVANVAAYAAAKSGVVALMHAVAQGERDNGVPANAVAPTSVEPRRTSIDGRKRSLRGAGKLPQPSHICSKRRPADRSSRCRKASSCALALPVAGASTRL
jgi:NAD(P)-dependent dehydrogenase (short-subunit alcohol dehydrogenase family)